MAHPAGHVSPSTIAALARHVPMSQVLLWAGVTLHGEGTQQVRCPIHADNKPSARYYADANRVYCFVCGKHYDAVSVAMHKLGCGVAEAVAWLTEKFGAPSAVDEMRAELSHVHTPTAPLTPLVDLIETRLREVRRCVDLPTFVRWCRVLDLVRVSLKDGVLPMEDAKPILATLYGQIYEANERSR
jgi:hypothetical protein